MENIDTRMQAMKEIDAVLTLTQELFGESPLSMERLPYGNINLVYEVATKREGRLIMQLHPEKQRVQLFYRGNWAMKLARERGIPVPSVLATGSTLVPYAYVVYRKIDGVTAVEYEGDKHKVWEELGLYTKRINLISVPGYGKVGYWKGSYREYYDTWSEFVTQEFEETARSHWLDSEAVITRELRAELLRRVEETKSWDFQPKLLHGDIMLKNTIVDPDTGALRGIIDWDELSFGKAPEQELAATFPWISEDERASFLAGYGMAPEEWKRIERSVETLELLKYVDFYIWFAYSKDEKSAADMRQKFISMLEKGA